MYFIKIKINENIKAPNNIFKQIFQYGKTERKAEKMEFDLIFGNSYMCVFIPLVKTKKKGTFFSVIEISLSYNRFYCIARNISDSL